MVHNFENIGIPESSNIHKSESTSNTPEWRPPQNQVGNGRIDQSEAEKELNTNLWPGVSPGNLRESGPNSFTTHTTGYWPAPSEQVKAQKWEAVANMEWGDKDREGNLIWPDHTIDAVEQKMKSGGLWPDDYVAVAMDSGAYPYGTNLTSPAYPGIPFRVVDTGGAFKWAWTTKVDIATREHDRMSKLTADDVSFQVSSRGIT